ncbi:hypothetical protein BGZ72_002952, partial [Mortierella alpina]
KKRDRKTKFYHLSQTAKDNSISNMVIQDMDRTSTPVLSQTGDTVHQQNDGLDFPSIGIDSQTKQMIAQTRWALSGRTEAVHFYSDGSLIKQGTNDISMSFGSVFRCVDGSHQRAIYGTTTGFASSTKAELIGLLATILCCPRDQQCVIHIDNQAVVTKFSSLVKHRNRATARQKLRSTYALWWDIVNKAYIQQGKQVNVQW